jgi:hypothetical protein
MPYQPNLPDGLVRTSIVTAHRLWDSEDRQLLVILGYDTNSGDVEVDNPHTKTDGFTIKRATHRAEYFPVRISNLPD